MTYARSMPILFYSLAVVIVQVNFLTSTSSHILISPACIFMNCQRKVHLSTTFSCLSSMLCYLSNNNGITNEIFYFAFSCSCVVTCTQNFNNKYQSYESCSQNTIQDMKELVKINIHK